MKFTFLGTGTSQGVPVIACPCHVCNSNDYRDKRLRTSGMLTDGETTVVFDTGPDFRQQMLREKVKVLDGVIFTHPHKDHTAGLDDVRAFNFLLEREMDVYVNDITLESLKREFAYIFEENKYPGVPNINVSEIKSFQKFSVGKIQLLPVEVMHHKMIVLGFRVKNFAYITDANFIPLDTMNHLMRLDVLVINALRIQKHISHFNLEEALGVIRELNPRKAYLTHISHLMGTQEEVSRLLPSNVEIAYDGLTIEC
ncbi:MAG: MBL fold metallo-hydrolase [Bacteroidia bacterium]|nr:MBL fold metallo-hydrolase [Bacteroidia bacterium]